MVSSLFLRLFSASHSPSRGESMPFCLLRSLSISSWASPCLIHARRSYQVYDRNCCSAPAKVEENGVRRKWCQTPSRPQSHQEFGKAVERPCAAVVGQLAPHDAHGKTAEHPIRDPFSLREGERHRSGAFVASPGDVPFRRPSVEAQRELPVHHRHVKIV